MINNIFLIGNAYFIPPSNETDILSRSVELIGFSCICAILAIVLIFAAFNMDVERIDRISKHVKAFIFILLIPFPIIFYISIKLYRHYVWHEHKTRSILWNHIVSHVDSYFGLYLGILSVLLGSFIYLAIKQSKNKNLDEFLHSITGILKKSKASDTVFLLMPSVMPGLFQHIIKNNSRFEDYKNVVLKKINEGVKIKFAVLKTDSNYSNSTSDWHKINNLIDRTRADVSENDMINLKNILDNSSDLYIKHQEEIFKSKFVADAANKYIYYKEHAKYIIELSRSAVDFIYLKEEFADTRIIAVVNETRPDKYYIGNYSVENSFEFYGMTINDDNASKTIAYFVDAIIEKHRYNVT